jgi:hypothetical protein
MVALLTASQTTETSQQIHFIKCSLPFSERSKFSNAHKTQRKINTNHNMTVPTTDHNTRRRHLEESYVDDMQGRRSLANVLTQIDGLGPPNHRRGSQTRRRPIRRSEVSLMEEESPDTQATHPVRQRAHTPYADPSLLIKDDATHVK